MNSAQARLFTPTCPICEDSGVQSIWTRRGQYGTKYTIPIHCSCDIGKKMFLEKYNREHPDDLLDKYPGS